MRVKLFCLCLCLILLLTGCTQSRKVQTEVKFDFELVADNGTFFINAEVHEDNMKCIVLSPENISGLTFIFSEDRVDTEFLGHQQSFSLEKGDFGVLGLLYRAFEALKDTEAVKSGDKFIAEVEAEGENFTFTVTELGIPLSVKFEDTEIFFKNITNL